MLNHLLDIARHGLACKALLVDVEGTGGAVPAGLQGIGIEIHDRALPKMETPLLGKLSALLQLLFGVLPRSAAVVASKRARHAVAEADRSGQFDVLVLEHLNSYGIIRGLDLNLPIHYIAQNIETEVLQDQIRFLPSTGFLKWALRLDCLKMRRIEQELIRKASAITLISSRDLSSDFLRAAAGKTTVWPELPLAKPAQWKHAGTRQLLFVGSAGYFPNRDAIVWLIEEFMPALLRVVPQARLVIAGTAASEIEIKSQCPAVEFAGFVSDERLSALHLESDLFVCPVILGGGIKIKVLEAASYGLPVAATSESLKGIDFLQGSADVFDRNAPRAADEVGRLLLDPDRLTGMSRRSLAALANATARRAPLVSEVPSPPR